MVCDRRPVVFVQRCSCVAHDSPAARPYGSASGACWTARACGPGTPPYSPGVLVFVLPVCTNIIHNWSSLVEYILLFSIILGTPHNLRYVLSDIRKCSSPLAKGKRTKLLSCVTSRGICTTYCTSIYRAHTHTKDLLNVYYHSAADDMPSRFLKMMAFIEGARRWTLPFFCRLRLTLKEGYTIVVRPIDTAVPSSREYHSSSPCIKHRCLGGVPHPPA